MAINLSLRRISSVFFGPRLVQARLLDDLYSFKGIESIDLIGIERRLTMELVRQPTEEVLCYLSGHVL
jgi:hypothetical protein